MQIGCLGEIIFEVSDSVLKTIRDATWSGSAAISTHQRHLDNALQEFVGVNPDSFQFSIRISQFLGANPLDDIGKLFSYERNGTAVQLTIGSKGYGKYRWLVSKHEVSLEHFDKEGNLVGADISVSLTEYLRE